MMKKLAAVPLLMVLCVAVLLLPMQASFTPPNDFLLLVSRGLVAGHSSIIKFGRNPDVDTAAVEDVWDGGGIWVPPTTARIHDIVSTSVADAAAGTGGQTIRIFALDASFLEIEEDITLNGTTNVPTVNSMTMIWRIHLLTAGSGGENAGTITATAQTDGTVTAQVNPGNNHSMMAIYQVPAGKSAFGLRYWSSLNRSTGVGGSADMRVVAIPFGLAMRLEHVMGLAVNGTSQFSHQFLAPLAVAEKTIIKIQADVSANNTDVSAGFDFILIDN